MNRPSWCTIFHSLVVIEVVNKWRLKDYISTLKVRFLIPAGPTLTGSTFRLRFLHPNIVHRIWMLFQPAVNHPSSTNDDLTTWNRVSNISSFKTAFDEFLIKYRNVCWKSKFFAENRNFCWKSNFLLKIEMFAENRNFCWKSKFLLKIDFAENRNFCWK